LSGRRAMAVTASAALLAFTPLQLMHTSRPRGSRLVMQNLPDLGIKPKLEELTKTIPDLGIQQKLAELPEPVQPWVKTYSAQPKLFAGDAFGLLLSTGLNPLAAFPYALAYYAAAQPLGALDKVPGNAYSDEATAGYQELVHNLGPAWAAGTAGGLLLSAPFADPFGPFAVFEWLGKGIVTFVCLGGPRAVQVFFRTDKLPELNFNFDLDAALAPKDK